MKKLQVTSYYSGDDGTYISVMPDSKAVAMLMPLYDILKAKDIKGAHPLINWHTTVMYSKDVIDGGLELYHEYSLQIDRVFNADLAGVTFWPGHDNKGVIVLQLHCEELTALHESLKAQGLATSYPDYEAHMTLVEDVSEELDQEQIDELVAELNAAVFEITDTITLTGLKVEDCK